MRVYSIEELDPAVMQRLEENLEAQKAASGVEKLYWLPLEENLLLDIQKQHQDSCGPHVMALEIREDAVRLELLVRAKGRLRCECVCYLSAQSEWMVMRWLDALVEQARVDTYPCLRTQ